MSKISNSVPYFSSLLMSKLHIYELEKSPLSVSPVFYTAFKTNNIITLRHLSSHENEP